MISLTGYKTKIVIVLTLIYAVSGLVLGKLDANTSYMMILAAIGSYGVYDKIDRIGK